MAKRYCRLLNTGSGDVCRRKSVGKKTTVSEYVAPEGLVKGGAFIDWFLPVPVQGKLRSDVWGASNVIPRAVNKGIENT